MVVGDGGELVCVSWVFRELWKLVVFEFFDWGSIEVVRWSCFCSLDNVNNCLIFNISVVVFFVGKRD